MGAVQTVPTSLPTEFTTGTSRARHRQEWLPIRLVRVSFFRQDSSSARWSDRRRGSNNDKQDEEQKELQVLVQTKRVQDEPLNGKWNERGAEPALAMAVISGEGVLDVMEAEYCRLPGVVLPRASGVRQGMDKSAKKRKIPLGSERMRG